MASSSGVARDLQVAGEDVFWVDLEGLKRAAGSGALSTLWPLNYTTIAGVDDTYVYFWTGAASAYGLNRVPRNGGQPELLSSKQARPALLAGDFIYGAGDGNEKDSLLRIPKTGGVEELVTGTAMDFGILTRGMASDGTDVYWYAAYYYVQNTTFSDSRINRVSPPSLKATALYAPGSGPPVGDSKVAVAVNGSVVCWNAHGISCVAKDGGPVWSYMPLGDEDEYTGLALDGSHVYFVGRDACGPNISRQPIALTGPIEVIARRNTTGMGSYPITLTPTHVYWGDGNAIYRRAK